MDGVEGGERRGWRRWFSVVECWQSLTEERNRITVRAKGGTSSLGHGKVD